MAAKSKRRPQGAILQTPMLYLPKSKYNQYHNTLGTVFKGYVKSGNPNGIVDSQLVSFQKEMISDQ